MGFETIPAKELDRLVPSGRGVIIDLRSPEEYRQRHIRGAINLPYERWNGKFPYSEQQEIILYCERGSVSMAAARDLAEKGAAARDLAEKGYRVKTVVGGIRAYRGANLEGIDVKKHR